MTATTRDIEGDLPEQPVQTPDSPEAVSPAVEPGLTPEPGGPASAVETVSEGATTAPAAPPLLMNAPADRCRVCAAEMASDQRYCVECGTRRGKPRFTLAKSTTSVTKGAPAASPSPLAAGWTRLTALLAIVIVLLALGIGVLIGSSGTQAVKVQLTGGAISSAGNGNSASTKASKTASSGAGKSAKTPGNLFSSGS